MKRNCAAWGTAHEPHDLQRRFVARIRDPQQALPPGIATERMAIYEELFFNNLDGFISSGFPVLRQLFDEPRWHRLVRAFMREHRCRTPHFSHHEEFIGWLQDGYRAEGRAIRPSCWSWLTTSGSSWPGRWPRRLSRRCRRPWSWSPLCLATGYRWPVHRLGPRAVGVECAEADTRSDCGVRRLRRLMAQLAMFRPAQTAAERCLFSLRQLVS